MVSIFHTEFLYLCFVMMSLFNIVVLWFSKITLWYQNQTLLYFTRKYFLIFIYYYPHLSSVINLVSFIQQPESFKTKKIFVGGLKPETTEEKLKEYFGQHGKVCQLCMDDILKQHSLYIYYQLLSIIKLKYIYLSILNFVGWTSRIHRWKRFRQAKRQVAGKLLWILY